MSSDYDARLPFREQRIAIFASGSGTNAENVIQYFAKHASIYVALIVCNKSGAGVIQVAERYGVACEIVQLKSEDADELLLQLLRRYRIDMVLLAGFLALVPSRVISAFPHRIINLHPALLPKFGGKGMYGKRVHQSVLAAGESETGITIHEVDEIYDHGAIVFQARVPVTAQDTPETIEEKVRELEYRHLPRVVEKLLLTERN